MGHILSNKEGSIKIWIQERWNEECCQVKIKVYMSLYSTIFPIFWVISDDVIRYLISITQMPQFLLNNKIYYDKGSTIHPYLEYI